MKNKAKSILKYTIYTIILVVVGVALYSSFEYTLIAEVRESVVLDVNEQDSLAYGKLLFETRGCGGCHSLVLGGGSTFAPNLADIAGRETTEYLRESIESPDVVIVDGYPADVMPKFGQILNDTQVSALVAYLSTFK